MVLSHRTRKEKKNILLFLAAIVLNYAFAAVALTRIVHVKEYDSFFPLFLQLAICLAFFCISLVPVIFSVFFAAPSFSGTGKRGNAVLLLAGIGAFANLFLTCCLAVLSFWLFMHSTCLIMGLQDPIAGIIGGFIVALGTTFTATLITYRYGNI